MTKNVAESVRARLLNLAHDRGDEFQLVLLRYANERLLYRLAKSEHVKRFVLKGAALFTVWTGAPHRATRDLDLLGFGDPAEESVRKVFEDVFKLDVEDDGLRFDLATLEAGPIREDQEYGGVRITIVAHLTTAKISLQIDVGFGDAVTPEAREIEFPTLLEMPAPKLRAYPRETVVAEKLEAMTKLGVENSRMKDFYDVAVMAKQFAFDGDVLVRAIRATFDRRGTAIPTELPVALTSTFADDRTKNAQWTAFVRKADVEDAGTLATTIDAVTRFLREPLAAASKNDATWNPKWLPGGGWS